jgi:acyl carrier protein
VPVGRPISNTQIYLLDSELAPVPIGIAGELSIGGRGVARGYLNRAELTAEKFIPDPFGAAPGARRYRTGDLARYLPDGKIEFLGRIDRQVKVRGFRIEAGEIEAALSEHPAVRAAVVTAHEDAGGFKQLVAYVVADPERAPVGDLRDHLRGKLPEHMVPSIFVHLDSLPRMPNGKLDHRALPAPGEHLRRQGDFVAPRTQTERQLAEIWQGVLKLERIGATDNFFDLGGHSLLATQVLSRAREAFDLDLPLRVIFDAPTLAGMAEVIAERLGQSGRSRLKRPTGGQESSPSAETRRRDLMTERQKILNELSKLERQIEEVSSHSGGDGG